MAQGHRSGTSSSSNTLKIDDLCDELSTVSDWYQLGLKLGVPDDKLDEIQRNHSLHQRKREALNLWLQLKHDASWMSIERVLQRMGEKTLAKRIRQTYLRSPSPTSPFDSCHAPTPVAPPIQQSIQVHLSDDILNEMVQDIPIGHDQLSKITPYLVTLNKTDVVKLGLELGLQYSTLVGLPDENFINPMLTCWLKEADNVRSKGKTSWSSLVRGLRKVQQNGIANMIARDHHTTDLQQVQPTENVPVYVSANSDITRLQSDLREHENSNESGASTEPTSTLTVQPSFRNLTCSKKDEIKAKLYEDEKCIQHEFGFLVMATCRSVQERVSVGLFRVSILSLQAYEPAPGVRNRSLLGEHSEEINLAKSVADIFAIVTPYMNYLSFDLLKYIIKPHGTNDDHTKLEKYERKLQEFLKQRIFELPLLESSLKNVSSKQAKFAVKFNTPAGTTGEELLQIRAKIAKILHVNIAALVLYCVKEGCVQLTFLIPKFVSQEKFPLSWDQTSALSKDAAVIFKSNKKYTEDAATQSTVLLEQNVLEDQSHLKEQLHSEKPGENGTVPGRFWVASEWKMETCSNNNPTEELH